MPTVCGLSLFFLAHILLKDLYLDDDPAPLRQAARAISCIQALYGVIPQVYGKGKFAAVSSEKQEDTKS